MKTNTRFAFLAATLTLALCYAPTARAATVTFDWATIGNPGNAGELSGIGAGGFGTDATVGGVANTYRISKTEVTNNQYTEFLNAVDPTGANADLGSGDGFLYNASMSSDARGGINFNSGAADGSKYEIKTGRDNNPVVFISFFDAMRFTNWLENGQGSGDTESGVYTIGSGIDEVRNPSATYFIPSEDEWYKAAYYDPNTTSYFDYPTSSDTVPTSEPPAGGTNSANYFDGTTGFAVTGTTVFDNAQNYLTDVGAYTTSLSPYGTYDQGGNVLEWNEALIIKTSLLFRGIRSGFFSNGSNILAASWRESAGPTAETLAFGFRVASIPEPSTLLLGAMAAVGLLMRKRGLRIRR